MSGMFSFSQVFVIMMKLGIAIAAMTCKWCHFVNRDLAFSNISVLPFGRFLTEYRKVVISVAVLDVAKSEGQEAVMSVTTKGVMG